MSNSVLFTESAVTRRVGAFYLAVVATLVATGVLFADSLAVAVTGWSGLAGESVHRLAFAWTLLLGVVVPAVLLFVRTERRVATVLGPPVVLVPLTAFAALESSPLLTDLAVVTALSLLTLVLHPELSRALRLARVDQPSPVLVGLVVVAAVPLLSLAVEHAGYQLERTGPHAQMLHWGIMSVAALYVVVMGLFAALRRRDWRFPAWTAGLLAVVLGATSYLFDAQSSAGDAWGAAGVVWGVLFVVAVEYVREEQGWPAPFIQARVVDRSSRDGTGSD